MSDGSISLKDYPYEIVVIACEPCGRRDQYSRAKLIVQYGLDISMADLKWRLTRCTRKAYNEFCRAYFPGLDDLPVK